MRFCPHCGAPLMAGAKFCVECGRQLGEAAAPAGGAASSEKRKAVDPSDSAAFRLTDAFIAVVFGIIIACLGTAAFIQFNRHATVPQGASSETPSAPSSPAAGSLPPGHPKIQLP